MESKRKPERLEEEEEQEEEEGGGEVGGQEGEGDERGRPGFDADALTKETP